MLDQTVVLAFLLHGRLCNVVVAVTCKIAGKPALFRCKFYFKIVLNVHAHNFLFTFFISFSYFSFPATVKNICTFFFVLSLVLSIK